MRFNFSMRPERVANTFEHLALCVFRSQGDPRKVREFAERAAKDSDCADLLIKASEVPRWGALLNARDANFLASVAKATVAAGTSSDATWASPLIALQTLQNGFLESLRFTSMLDDLAADMRPWMPGSRIAVNSATASGASSLDAVWKPLSKADWTTDTVVPHKSHALVVVTNELLFSALAQNAIGSELRRACSVAADNVLVPVLTSGLTPIVSSGGDARGDFDAALGEINLSANSKLHCYAPSNVLKKLALRGPGFGGAGYDGPAIFPDLEIGGGGSISGMSVMAVDALANTSSFGDAIVIVDASQLMGFAGVLVADASQEASLYFDDAASGSGAQSMVSLFSTSSTALRIERHFACERPRAASVAVISHAGYGAGSP